MAREKGQRQDQFLAHLTVDGVDCGYWDSHDGGDLEVQSGSRRVSGGKTIQLGGPITTSAITLKRLCRLPNRTIYDFLRTRAGKGEAVVSLQQKDPDGVPAGKPFVHTGVLGNVPLLKYDENSNDGLDEEITVDVDSE